MSYKLLKFSQPAGDFYLTTMPAREVIKISTVDVRRYDPDRHEALGGIQRFLSSNRVNEIASYTQSVDAAFPTPIILALKSDDCILNSDQTTINFHPDRTRFANVVDGQHRIKGLEASSAEDRFDLPVVLLIDATLEQQALIFATINGKQTKVSSSLIYDLFGLTTTRSPWKTSHELARGLNSDSTSPWYRRLKMLGRKSGPESEETLTQGTFVRELLEHISKHPADDFDALRRGSEPEPSPKAVFNKYFLRDADDTIYRILWNLFMAQKQTWEHEWNDPDNYILTKTTGFMGTMWALESLVRSGQENRSLSIAYFRSVFRAAKGLLEEGDKTLTAKSFPSSASGIRALRDVFTEALSIAFD